MLNDSRQGKERRLGLKLGFQLEIFNLVLLAPSRLLRWLINWLIWSMIRTERALGENDEDQSISGAFWVTERVSTSRDNDGLRVLQGKGNSFLLLWRQWNYGGWLALRGCNPSLCTCTCWDWS